jgi:hypothetical protein
MVVLFVYESFFSSYVYVKTRGGDGLAVYMSGQHICVLRVRDPHLPPCGYSGV